MPARTPNDFLAGFFMAAEKDVELDMTIIPGNNCRRSNRRQNHRREGNLESIKVGVDLDEAREVIVHYSTAPQRKHKTTFTWFEEFTMEWTETFI
jgi:hypothetical protein